MFKILINILFFIMCNKNSGLPWWLNGKESTCWHRRHGVDPRVRKSPGVGNGNPCQYSCLGNPMDRGAWWATVHGVAESDMIYQSNNNNKNKNSKLSCLEFVGWHFIELPCVNKNHLGPRFLHQSHVLSWIMKGFYGVFPISAVLFAPNSVHVCSLSVTATLGPHEL